MGDEGNQTATFNTVMFHGYCQLLFLIDDIDFARGT